MTDYSLTISDAEIRRYQAMAEHARQVEAPLWERAGIVPGATVADVGCGPAAMSVMLARAVTGSGRVVGVERDPAALAAAHRVVAAAGAQNVELRSGSASDTGLGPGSVDVVMCRHVLAHNGENEQEIVDHLAQLCRPGGTVYLVDADGTAMRMLDAPAEVVELADRYLDFHRARGNDLRTGLRLGKLLTAAGLEVLAFEGRYSILAVPPGLRPPAWAARDAMVDAGVLTTADVDRIGAAFESLDADPMRPTLFAPHFVALGRKH